MVVDTKQGFKFYNWRQLCGGEMELNGVCSDRVH